MSAGLQRTFASLSVPNYRRYFSGQVVSITGNWMQNVAEMWLVVQLTGNGVSVGFTAALQFLPILLFGAWGGLLADRISKRRLLTITQTLLAIPALTLWLLTVHGVGRAVDGLRARVHARLCERDRQPRAPELRDGDGRPRQASSTPSRSTRSSSTPRASSARRPPAASSR